MGTQPWRLQSGASPQAGGASPPSRPAVTAQELPRRRLPRPREAPRGREAPRVGAGRAGLCPGADGGVRDPATKWGKQGLKMMESSSRLQEKGRLGGGETAVLGRPPSLRGHCVQSPQRLCFL